MPKKEKKLSISRPSSGQRYRSGGTGLAGDREDKERNDGRRRAADVIGKNWNWIIAIIFAVFMLGLFFLHPGMKDFDYDLLVTVTAFWDVAPDLFPQMWSGIKIIIAILFGLTTDKENPYKGLIILLLLVVLITFYPFVSSYFSKIGFDSYLASMRCMIANANDPAGMTACQDITTKDPEEVESTKTGEYNILDVSFDTTQFGSTISKVNGYLQFDYTKDGKISSIYFLPIKLKLADENSERTIKNFRITDAFIMRSGVVTTDQKIRLANLEVNDGRCTEDDMCDIIPGRTTELTLAGVAILCNVDGRTESQCDTYKTCEWSDANGCQPKKDTLTEQADVIVKFSYDYEAQGKYDFIVANLDVALDVLLEDRADQTKSDGPIDVLVNFIPSYFVFRDTSGDMTTDVSVMIDLINEGDGTALVHNPVKISRSSTGVIVPSVDRECIGPIETDNLDPNDVYSDDISFTDGKDKSLTGEIRFICDYTVHQNSVGSNGEVVSFIAYTKYTYDDIVTRPRITVND